MLASTPAASSIAIARKRFWFVKLRSRVAVEKAKWIKLHQLQRSKLER
ncbi:MAG: hypothetical protein IGR93_13030 [Hydrococcus sp. C42_A2020_068]|nr:hypothetical protein [Pleurocapsa sp. PCC 7327]MBF2020995.1 hypothetical protein [Hydrococcus sp. C42_A2020_068]